MALPLAFTLLFGWIYSEVYTENIPLAVYDGDNSEISREIIEQFRNSSGFELVLRADSLEELKKSILDGKVKAGLFLPPDLQNDLLKQASPGVTMFVDGTNIVIGNNAYSYAGNILGTIGAGIQLSYLQAEGLVSYVAEQDMTTLSLIDRVLYNPQLSYFFYLFAVLLGIFIQQTYMNILSPRLIELKNLSLTKKEFFYESVKHISRSLGFSIISCLSCLIVANYFFNYPLNASFGLIMLILIIFLLNMTAVSYALAIIFKNINFCVQFSMLFSIPTFLSCGYTWPEYMIPSFLMALIKSVWPLYYFANPLREVLLKGAGFGNIENYIYGGFIFMLVWLPLMIFIYTKKALANKKA